MKVVFKRVPDWPGYRIGDDGSVWSLWKQVGHSAGEGPGSKRILNKKWKRMKLCFVNGYPTVNLSRITNGRWCRKTPRVHALLLSAFVGPRPAGFDACHKNGNRKDNRIINLRWDSRKNNCADTIRHGRSCRGVRCATSKLSDSDILGIRKLIKEGKTQIVVAAKYGIHQVSVSKIITGKRWAWLITDRSTEK